MTKTNLDVQLRVRISPEMMEQVDAMTNPYMGRSRSDVIRQLLAQALEKPV